MESAESTQDRADDIDARGVDRAQIRRMLGMSTADRLRWLEQMVDQIVAIERLNEKRAVR